MGAHGQSGIRKSSSKAFDKAWEFQREQEVISKLRAELKAKNETLQLAKELILSYDNRNEDDQMMAVLAAINKAIGGSQDG
jgi:hypothetical protein